MKHSLIFSFVLALAGPALAQEGLPTGAAPPVAPPSVAPSSNVAPSASNGHAATPSISPTPRVDAGDEGLQALVVDPRATRALEACLEKLKLGRPDAQVCLSEVLSKSPQSTAALRAQMLLDVMATGRFLVIDPSDLPPGGTAPDEATVLVQSGPDTQEPAPDEDEGLLKDLPISFNLTVGRLELSAVGGVFGVWNGVAGGIVLQSFLEGTGANPGFIILGAGALSAALGAAYAAGGFMLADDAAFGSSAGRLITTGLAVGTAMGVAGSFAAADILSPANLPFNIVTASTVGTAVVGGYMGGVAGGAAAYFLDLDAGQVSMINSGAALGVFNGLMLVPNLATAGAPIWSLSMAFMAVTALGLGSGYALSEILEFTWIEALICGGGSVLGVLALTPATAAAGPFLGIPFSGILASLWYTVPAMIGSLGGFAIAATAFAAWRYFNGETVLKQKWFAITPKMGDIITVLDKEGNPATIAPLVALEF